MRSAGGVVAARGLRLRDWRECCGDGVERRHVLQRAHGGESWWCVAVVAHRVAASVDAILVWSASSIAIERNCWAQ